MLQTFKIYVYPTNSNKSDSPSSSASFASFAAVFLPHPNPFNPKLENYFSEHMFKISLLSSEHNEDNFLSLCSESSIKNLEFRIRYTGFSNRFGFSIRRGKKNRRWGFMQGKVERFEKNRMNRKAVPETTAKKNKDIPVGPIIIGCFVFIVIGSKGHHGRGNRRTSSILSLLPHLSLQI